MEEKVICDNCENPIIGKPHSFDTMSLCEDCYSNFMEEMDFSEVGSED